MIDYTAADDRAARRKAAVPPIMWRPPDGVIAQATLTRYMGWLAAKRDRAFDDYDSLWRWSVDDLEGFWSSIWDFFDVRGQTPPRSVLDDRTMPGARWFPGATLNWAEHVLRPGNHDDVAIVHASEVGDLHEMTRGELRDLTARIAAGLRRCGVACGDRVVAYMPNIPEAVAGALACASIGAVWSSCSPDFGPRSVIDRFAQIEPKVLLAVDGYRYRGRDFDRRSVVEQLREKIPSLRHTVLLPYLDKDADLAGALSWDELVREPAVPRFEAVPFDHPLWVLYSSGTTGLPKGIVQGHGGILLEHLKQLHLHVDIGPRDRFFWFTTTGWMMWNFLVGGLLTGATIMLYDGHPGLSTLWDLAERARITCFGTSPSYIANCMKAGFRPAQGRDLGALRAVGATGSPLSAEAFDWVARELDSDRWLFSMSGGTDLCTAFASGCPILPVYRGEIQCRSLGARVEAWDGAGRPVIGTVGELVITEPMPSMPLYLWNDDSGERYRDTYFSVFPSTWRHGDWIEITDRGTAIIYGRSDSTINRGGIRMGTAEIYSAVIGIDEVLTALVVDVPRPGKENWMPLFVVLADDAKLDDELTRRIATRIREECSPRHVPDEIFAVAEVPLTLSGKVVEVPVKRILTGTAPEAAVSRDALANPDALDWFVEFARGRRAVP